MNRICRPRELLRKPEQLMGLIGLVKLVDGVNAENEPVAFRYGCHKGAEH